MKGIAVFNVGQFEGRIGLNSVIILRRGREIYFSRRGTEGAEI